MGHGRKIEIFEAYWVSDGIGIVRSWHGTRIEAKKTLEAAGSLPGFQMPAGVNDHLVDLTKTGFLGFLNNCAKG